MVRRFGTKRALRIALTLLIGWVWGSTAVYLSQPERGPRDPRWKHIQTVGILRVGIDPSIAPFGVWVGDGQIDGLDAQLGRMLAEEMGLAVEITPLTYDGYYDALTYDRVDVVIAALRPVWFRSYIARYSIPYFDAGHVLVSRDGFETFEMLAGKTLAVELASEGDLMARKFDEITPQRHLTPLEALASMADGEADAALVDNVTATMYLAEHAGLVKSAPVVSDPYVIAMRRNEWRLYYAIQEALYRLRDDGKLKTLIENWLVTP